MQKKNQYFHLILHIFSHPELWKYISTYYETWIEAKRKYIVHEYKEEILPIQKIYETLFPSSKYSLGDFKKNTSSLLTHILNFTKNLEKKSYPSKEKPYDTNWGLEINSALLLYIICKMIKPEKVVETGVAYGLASSYILQALDENKKGILYSIDFPFSPWQTKEMIGSITPVHLRSRRKFVYGPSSNVLKKLLQSIGSIDLFFHDSLHSYKNMKREFTTAWPFIKEGGFLISDDALHNNAFYELHKQFNLKPLLLSQKEKPISQSLQSPTKDYLGILKKTRNI